jgi:cell wall-associated NlpC family hydrolase
MDRVCAVLIASLAAAPAFSQSRQTVSEYISAALEKDPAFTPEERQAMEKAVRDSFAAYWSDIVKPGRAEGVQVVMRMIVEGQMDEAPPERIAEVAFAAYQAISRGAPPDVAEGIALYGYRKKISPRLISLWSNGYNELVKNKVPPEIGADLVRNAMEKDWDEYAFNTFKWALVRASKEGFDIRDYAVYLFGNMLQGKRMPGQITSEAHRYFKKLAKTRAAPELPPYQGVFSRMPVEEKALYEAKPQEEPKPEPKAPEPKPSPREEEKPAAPRTTPPEPRPSPREEEKPAAPRTTPPEPRPEPKPLGITLTALWPGLKGSIESYLGTPYAWGGNTRQGIDCSGLTKNTYGENRIGIPRVSKEQWRTGRPVEWEDLREGDLLFFDTSGSGVSHVGMLVSRDGLRMIHASSSKGVSHAEIEKRWFKTRYLGARRVVP